MSTTTRMLALALVMLAGTGCAVTAPPEKPWEKIRLGVEADVEPFEYRNEQGKLVGLNIDLLKAICAQIKASCEWVDQPYATNITALQAGRFDVIVPMTKTTAREEFVTFTDPLYPLKSALVARKDSGLLPDLNSLKGVTVGVLANTVREAFVRQEWAPRGVLVRSYNLNSELINGLRTGQIQATVQDIVEIRTAFLNKPEGNDYAIVGPAIENELLGGGPSLAVRKTDPELRDALNRGLQGLKDNGKYQPIIDRYLPSSASNPEPAQMIYTPADGGFPFSETVQVGKTLYISGMLGLDDKGNLVRGGIRAETAQALATLRDTLKKNGIGMDRVAKCTVILADIKDFAAMNKVYASYFPKDRLPARTTFAAGKLLADARIEIDCTASK